MSVVNNEFPTTDLTLASYLYASGVILIRVDYLNPQDSNQATFIFEQPKKELLSDFQSGKAKVGVLAYDDAQNELKSRLYKSRRNGR